MRARTTETRQARYQRRRRKKARPITFFPADRALLNTAIGESGLAQQTWIGRAVQERLKRQADLKELLADALQRFRTRCFWNVNVNQPLARLTPLIVTRLRKYGGRDGLDLAGKIERVAPEDVRWR